MPRWAICCVAVCCLIACGNLGDSDAGSAAGLGTCGLRTHLSGGVMVSFTGQDDAACLTQHSFDEGLDVDFIHTSTKVTVSFAIADVTEGETGDQYPTQVRVTSDTGRWESDACTMSISEHELLQTEASAIGELRHYQVSGQGACEHAAPGKC